MSELSYKENHPITDDSLHQISNEAIGKRIKQARLAHGISAEKMAEDLNTYTGKISRLETGKTEIKAGDLILISQYLGCSIEYFIMGKDAGYGCLTKHTSQPISDELVEQIEKLDIRKQGFISELIHILYKV